MKVWALTKAQVEQLPVKQKEHLKIIDPRQLDKDKREALLKSQQRTKAKGIKVKDLDSSKMASVEPGVISQVPSSLNPKPLTLNSKP